MRELVEAFNSVADTPIEAVDAEPRPGDVAGAYTRTDRATELLGWSPRFTVAEGIRHSLDWVALRDQLLPQQ